MGKSTPFLLLILATIICLTNGACFGNDWKKRDKQCRGLRYNTRHSYAMTDKKKRNYCCDDAPSHQCWFNDWKSRDRFCQGRRYNYRYSYKTSFEQSILVGTKYCCSDPIVKGPTCFHNDWQARDKACVGKRYAKRYSLPAKYFVRDLTGYVIGGGFKIPNGRYYCCRA
ncbi:hypothetical protein Fcan01_22762 [Folsomia candida]|uniref:Uncharacterized protein n=1 Tax=Folsomia candida TaxID=158441 RepID=A0A226DD10_FOLCA|nr:hypothetical protein Fcan01_22762 [Folsomia candida]